MKLQKYFYTINGHISGNFHYYVLQRYQGNLNKYPIYFWFQGMYYSVKNAAQMVLNKFIIWIETN